MSDFSSIEEIIQDARDGKMYILVDSEDRENEGDIIIPASLCKPDHINFMATHGRGLICLSISESRASELKLPLMNPDNWKKKTTAFTVSIESSKNITTGISAFDRAETVKAAINPDFKPGGYNKSRSYFSSHCLGWGRADKSRSYRSCGGYISISWLE